MSETGSRLDPVAVALDTNNWSQFSQWCGQFGPRVGVLKVGLEAFVRWGERAVEAALAAGGRVFLDLKLHDIPNTVAGAVRAAGDLGVSYLTVHAAGGPEMLAAAVNAAPKALRILAVTVLTHLDEDTLWALDLPGDSGSRARRWAGMARQAGCHGAVCSPLEVATLRRDHPAPFLLVTPGIRQTPVGPGDDQRRTATAAQALESGADLVVIGRPLTRAADPERALCELEESL